jgi:CheY-like chemotaxis protein
MAPVNLQSLVIDGDSASKQRLKQAMMAFPLFGKSVQSFSFADGQSRMVELDRIDVVFISDKLDSNERAKFIDSLKKNERSQDAAFVLITSSKNTGNLAEGFLNGADGVLSEPFSADNLKEITELAEAVKKQRERVRAELGIQLLVKDIVAQVNNVASVAGSGMDPSRQVAKLREFYQELNKLEPELQTKYLMMVADEFEKAPPHIAPKLKEAYKGISDRVKRRLEKKLTK